MDQTVSIAVRRDGPGGCPVLHGFNPLGAEEVNHPEGYSGIAREQAPVFFVPEAGMYIATRHADVERVLTDWRAFAPVVTPVRVPDEAADILPEGFVFQRQGQLSASSPPEHTRVRKLAQKAFTRPAALRQADRIRALCNSLVDEFADAGEVELVSAYTSKFPIRVMGIVLGIDEAETDQLYLWAIDVFRLFGDHQIPHDEMMAICHRQRDWTDWTLALIDERRRNPREDDLITTLVQAREDDGSSRLTDSEIFSVIVSMIGAGADTSSATAAQMIRRMLSDDDLRARVMGDRSLLEPFIEEELRHDFVGRMAFRMTTEPVELGGVELPTGALVGAHMWSANHDESAFREPARFDLDREDVDKLLSWGKGTHFCLGTMLARVEISIAVETVFDRLPRLRLVPGHELERMPAFFLPSVHGGLVVAWDPS